MESKPPKYQFLNDNEREELAKYYNGRQLSWCQIGENKCFMPHGYKEQGESIWRMKVKPTDNWIVTFPRSGTTWIQELVWLLNNNLNYEEASRKLLTERTFFLEFDMLNLSIDKDAEENKKGPERLMLLRKVPILSDTLESMASPRFFKTHMPFELLPPGLLDAGCKVIYVARNPKEVVVSFYYVTKLRNILKYTGDFPTFWNFFQRDLISWCPYWPHVKKAWSLRHHPNLLFLFYEEMKMDLPGTIKRVAEFYERPCTDEEITELSNYLNFENFKKNPMIASRKIGGQELVSKDIFVRNGKVGEWRELFTPELEAQADKWIEENLRDTDLVFPQTKITK